MEQINQYLENERNGFLSHRGLDNSGIVSFVGYLSPEMRAHYSDKFSRVLAHSRKEKRREKPKNIEDHKQKVKPLVYDTPGVIKASNVLHDFFQAFIERSHDFPRQTVKRSPMRSLLNLPPPEHGQRKNVSTFCEDENSHFVGAVLRGMEFDLIIFYSLLHGVCDMLWGSTILSLLLVYITDRMIVSFRKHFGKVNLAAKTMVDYKFLV